MRGTNLPSHASNDFKEAVLDRLDTLVDTWDEELKTCMHTTTVNMPCLPGWVLGTRGSWILARYLVLVDPGSWLVLVDGSSSAAAAWLAYLLGTRLTCYCLRLGWHAAVLGLRATACG